MSDTFSGANDLLFGWDLAFVTSFARINAAIVEQKSSPTAIDYSDGKGAVLTGTFGDWQLATDNLASGDLVVMDVPLTAAKLTKNNREFPLAKQTFRVEIQLEFVEPASGKVWDQTAALAGDRAHLRTLGKGSVATHGSSVKVRSPNATDAVQNAFAALLQGWMNAHLDDFGHVFTKATFGLTASSPDLQWLMPQAFTYAVSCPDKDEDRTPENSVFAVLCATKRASLARLTPQTSIEALPSGAHAAILVSSRLMLENMFKPVLAMALHAKQAPDLALTDGAPCLTNLNKITLPDFDLSGITGFEGKKGTSPTIDVGNLNVSVADGHMVLDITDLHFVTSDQMEEIYVTFSSRYALELSSSGHLKLTESDKSTASGRVALTEAATKYEIYMTLALAVVFALISIVPGGAEAEAASATAVGATEVATSEVAVEASATTAVDDAASSAAESELAAGTVAKTGLRNFAKVLAKKLAIGMLAAAGTSALSRLPELVKAMQGAKPDFTPTMHDLAAQVMQASIFNDSDPGKPICTSVALRNCLMIGVRFPTA